MGPRGVGGSKHLYPTSTVSQATLIRCLLLRLCCNIYCAKTSAYGLTRDLSDVLQHDMSRQLKVRTGCSVCKLASQACVSYIFSPQASGYVASSVTRRNLLVLSAPRRVVRVKVMRHRYRGSPGRAVPSTTFWRCHWIAVLMLTSIHLTLALS